MRILNHGRLSSPRLAVHVSSSKPALRSIAGQIFSFVQREISYCVPEAASAGVLCALLAVFDEGQRMRTDSPRETASNGYSSAAPSPEPLHYYPHLQYQEPGRGEIEVNEAILKGKKQCDTPIRTYTHLPFAIALSLCPLLPCTPLSAASPLQPAISSPLNYSASTTCRPQAQYPGPRDPDPPLPPDTS
ncbi:partitioning defective 3 homolog B-like isoform X1 [Lates japonicus]|uniref:Partitioning defective 3 homolog B-like isoform X1 n=1 Tax=Lates japonicus TaxID=270547 RepID=A0AAD3NN32_LATJO|nr:partitioning defective 3 homolog B-like isoform X1 [Lates japonicus]